MKLDAPDVNISTFSKWCCGGGKHSFGHRSKMRTVKFRANNNLIGTHADRAAYGRRAFGQKRGYPAVQDAVRLVNFWSDFDAQDNFLGRRGDDFDAELVVHVRTQWHDSCQVFAHLISLENQYPSTMTRCVDLRSDTITQPTQAMRDAIASADVGDDGYGEDPTISELEKRFANVVGKEASVFVPSGVMANQIALRVLASPGDAIVAGRSQHLVSFEMGAASRNSSVQFATVDDTDGTLSVSDVLDVIDAEKDHQPHVAVVTIENTHMFAGGVPWDVEELRVLSNAIGERSLHLDGARLFNAVIATGTSAAEYSQSATTVMACLSKGLCAPVGSLLAGPLPLMERARIERKRLGGAMRQAGFLAAAGLIALDTMVDRLKDDHDRARQLATHFAATFPESNYDPETCRTNIVSFNHPQARQIVEELTSLGVEGGTVSPRRARFVTHAGISDDDVDFVADVLTRFVSTSH